jgi:tetratricopeptide (TPR) repeat protein
MAGELHHFLKLPGSLSQGDVVMRIPAVICRRMKSGLLHSGVKLSRLVQAVLVALTMLLFSTQVKAEPVDDDYNKAYQHFLMGNYGEASAMLRNNLTTDAGHTPSQLLLAKILYRQEQYNEAAKYFSKVSPKTLDPDTAFEYGVSMYGAKRCGPALKGFLRVPKNHHLQNYVRFYSGICYLEKGEPAKAIIKLRLATGLPPLHNSMRRHLIDTARQAVQASKSGEPPAAPTADEVRPEASAPISQKPKAPAPSQKQAAPSSQKQAPAQQKQAVPAKETPPPSPFTWDITPAAVYKYTNYLANYHNYVDEEWQLRETSGSLSLNSKMQLSRGKKESSALTFSLFGKKYHASEEVDKQAVKIRDDGQFEWQKVKTSPTKYDTEEFLAAPGFLVPFTEKNSLTVKGEYGLKKDRMDKTLNEERRSALAGLRGALASTDIDLGVKYTELYDARHAPKEYNTKYNLGFSNNIKTVDVNLAGSYLMREPPAGKELVTAASETEGSLSFTLPVNKSSVSASVSYKLLTPPQGQQYVDTYKMEDTNFEITIEHGFEMGLTVKAFGGYEIFKDFYFKELAVGDIYTIPAENSEKRLGIANGSSVAIGGAISYKVVEFLTLNGFVNQQFSQFKINDPGIETAFYKNAADESIEWSATVALSKTF